MQKILKLRKSILINGSEMTELKYDTDKITGELFQKADSECGIGTVRTSVMEVDTSFHFNLGCAAIIAENSQIDWNDLKRIKGYDLIEITRIGRSFITGSEEELQQSNSDEPIETTQESITQA